LLLEAVAVVGQVKEILVEEVAVLVGFQLEQRVCLGCIL
jgi:hypothetical protein